METRTESRFHIRKLEERIAPAAFEPETLGVSKIILEEGVLCREIFTGLTGGRTINVEIFEIACEHLK